MIMKVIGALMILGVSGWVGFRIAAEQRREESIQQQLIAALDYMQCELQYRRTALPELCRKAAAETTGKLREVFLNLSHELEDQISPDVQLCMHAALVRCKSLPTTVISCLQLLGQTLGRFDLDGQLLGFEAVRQTCRLKLDALRCNRDVRLRSYQTLGLCAGAALVILFI